MGLVLQASKRVRFVVLTYDIQTHSNYDPKLHKETGEINYFGVYKNGLFGHGLSQTLHWVRKLKGKPELNEFGHSA